MRQTWCRYYHCTWYLAPSWQSLFALPYCCAQPQLFSSAVCSWGRAPSPWSPPPVLWFALGSAGAPGTHQVHSLQRKLHQCVSSANPDVSVPGGQSRSRAQQDLQDCGMEVLPSALRLQWLYQGQPKHPLSTLLAKCTFVFQTLIYMYMSIERTRSRVHTSVLNPKVE